MRFLSSVGAYITKIHGEAMQERGLPDIIGCLDGHYFAFEVKRLNLRPSPLQQHHLDAIDKAGGLSAVVTSVEEVEEALYKACLIGR